MQTRISDEDIEHLQAFPDSRKAAVMKRIGTLKPAESIVLEGDEHFDRAVVRLRRDGFGLIDLQRQETAFTSVWYRRSRTAAAPAGPEVAMLLWEAGASGDGETTLMTWRV